MQNFKVYLLIFCFTFLTKCTSYETATIIDNEDCKLSQVNKILPEMCKTAGGPQGRI